MASLHDIGAHSSIGTESLPMHEKENFLNVRSQDLPDDSAKGEELEDISCFAEKLKI